MKPRTNPGLGWIWAGLGVFFGTLVALVITLSGLFWILTNPDMLELVTQIIRQLR